MRMMYETVKVRLGVLIAFNATFVMSKTIGLFFRGGVTMWETKETLEGGAHRLLVVGNGESRHPRRG